MTQTIIADRIETHCKRSHAARVWNMIENHYQCSGNSIRLLHGEAMKQTQDSLQTIMIRKRGRENGN